MKRPRIKVSNRNIGKNRINKHEDGESLKRKKKNIEKRLKRIKDDISNRENLINKTIRLQSKILNTEITFRKNMAFDLLKHNSDYVRLKKEHKENKRALENWKNELAKLETLLTQGEIELKEIIEKIRLYDERKSELESQIMRSDEKTTNVDSSIESGSKLSDKDRAVKIDKQKDKVKGIPELEFIFEADWSKVYFDDSKIVISYDGKWYEKYVLNARKYLNEIKHHYNFRNVPRLKIKVVGRNVHILNEEVLFYHIEFLSSTASNFEFGISSNLNLTKWKRYNRKFYYTHLSFLMHGYTINRLCEMCIEDLPIVPVGEVVINNHGFSALHCSFLFPLRTRTGYLLIWESIEEGKASYVFFMRDYSLLSIQNIYNYIAGPTQNKRSTLMYSEDLQRKLGLVRRVMHTDLKIWETEIKQLIAY